VLLLVDGDVVATVVEHVAVDTPVEEGGLVDTDQANEALDPEDALEALEPDDVEHLVVAPSAVVADIPASSGSGDLSPIEPRATSRAAAARPQRDGFGGGRRRGRERRTRTTAVHSSHSDATLRHSLFSVR